MSSHLFYIVRYIYHCSREVVIVLYKCEFQTTEKNPTNQPTKKLPKITKLLKL